MKKLTEKLREETKKAIKTLETTEKEDNEFRSFINKIFEYEKKASGIREIPRSIAIWWEGWPKTAESNGCSWDPWFLCMKRDYSLSIVKGRYGNGYCLDKLQENRLPKKLQNSIRKIVRTLTNPKKRVKFLLKRFQHVLEDETLTGEYSEPIRLSFFI